MKGGALIMDKCFKQNRPIKSNQGIDPHLQTIQPVREYLKATTASVGRRDANNKTTVAQQQCLMQS